MTPFTEHVIHIIQSIPQGKVASYGQIAKAAGNSRGARQVSRIIHSCSAKYQLPWHRVINSQGKISLTDEGYIRQFTKLLEEGVEFGLSDKVDFKRFGFFN